MPWNLDPRVRSAMISDSLDVVGIRHNAMDVNVSALRPGMRAAGLAATVKFVPDSQYNQKDPYGAGIDFLDTLHVGEVAGMKRVAVLHARMRAQSAAVLVLDFALAFDFAFVFALALAFFLTLGSAFASGATSAFLAGVFLAKRPRPGRCGAAASSVLGSR